MALRNHIVWMLTLGVAALAAPVAASDSQAEKVTPPGEEYSATSATIERIIETAVRNIARRYNLNEAQTRKTDELWNREVHQFLREHEAEVWPAIRGLLTAQQVGGPPGDSEELKRLGKTIRPLAQLVKEAAYRANEEWREILTAEQKRLHDYDMDEMRKAFDQVDSNFASWESGEPSQGGRVFPRPAPPGTGPPTPPRPEGPELPPPIKRFITVRVLDTLVEEFIKDYELNEGQITAARSILAEFKAKANDFIKAKKDEFAKIHARLEKAEQQRDAEGIRQATKAHKKMLEPFHELVQKMNERLKGLLTTTQIQRYAERNKADAEKPKVKKTETKAPSKTASTTKATTKEGEPPAKKDKE